MSSLARIEAEAPPDLSESAESEACLQLRDYVPFIQHALSAQGISIRKLAVMTSISRNRLCDILRSDRSRGARPAMTLIEFQIILQTLKIEVLHAVLGVEALQDLSLLKDGRFTTAFEMIAEIASSLPSLLVDALNEVDGMDGTEIRREWAVPLRKGMVERVVKEVTAVIQRRRDMDFGS